MAGILMRAGADKKSETKKPITFRAAALVPLHCHNRCSGPCSAQGAIFVWEMGKLGELL